MSMNKCNKTNLVQTGFRHILHCLVVLVFMIRVFWTSVLILKQVAFYVGNSMRDWFKMCHQPPVTSWLHAVLIILWAILFSLKNSNKITPVFKSTLTALLWQHQKYYTDALRAGQTEVGTAFQLPFRLVSGHLEDHVVIKKNRRRKTALPGKDAIKDKTEHKGQGNRVAVQNTTANLSPLSLINCWGRMLSLPANNTPARTSYYSLQGQLMMSEKCYHSLASTDPCRLQ